MTARSPHEHHRASTPLELFFDLVFVVAIAQAASGLHHAIGDAHAMQGLVGYLMVFFAIWWAWMNFTWFASAYDCDDVPYRLAVFVQISGALILAAGVPAMFESPQPNLAVVTGYVVMRLAMVAQWLRAAASDPGPRVTARRYALGITVLQLAWVGMLWIPHLWRPGFITLAALELAVPVWAERTTPTTWHPQHIAERYGLLTLIVLGESILAATVAVQAALASGEALSPLLPIIVGGLLIAYSMWWMYFDRPVHDLLTSLRKAIMWGYGHYLIFASAAAVGAGLAVSVDQATHHAKVSAAGAGVRGRNPSRDLPHVPLVSPRPAGVPSDPMARPDRRGARAADAVHGLRRASHRRDSGLGRCPQARACARAGNASRVSMMISKVVRRTHMYLALFLFPWVLMYALSTLVMNHRALFVSAYGEGPVPFVEERRLVYDGVFPENAELRTDLEADSDVGRTRWRARRVAAQGRNHRHQPERPRHTSAPHLLSRRSHARHRTDGAASRTRFWNGSIAGEVTPPAMRSTRSGRSRSISSSSRWCSGCCRGSGCGGR